MTSCWARSPTASLPSSPKAPTKRSHRPSSETHDS
jgi:hypothetical protein